MNEYFSPFLKQYFELFIWLEWRHSILGLSYIVQFTVNHILGIASRVLLFLPFNTNHVSEKRWARS